MVSTHKRFMDKVKVHSNGCWLWTACTDGGGYGLLKLAGTRTNVKAHRYSYEQYNGNIPTGLMIRHTCDTPACVNPEHLELGTHDDNMNDRRLRGRTAIGVNHSQAKLTVDDVNVIRSRLHNGDTQRVIATDYNIAQSLVSAINTGKLWRY